MSDPILNLKNSMKKTVFKNLTFSEERKKAVKESIHSKQFQPQMDSWKEETLIAVLESLSHEAKDGYAISTSLFHKHDLSFKNNEGQLYSLLHLLEKNEIVASKWMDDKKYYVLTRRGIKCLTAYHQGSVKHRLFLKNVIEEASF